MEKETITVKKRTTSVSSNYVVRFDVIDGISGSIDGKIEAPPEVPPEAAHSFKHLRDGLNLLKFELEQYPPEQTAAMKKTIDELLETHLGIEQLQMAGLKDERAYDAYLNLVTNLASSVTKLVDAYRESKL